MSIYLNNKEVPFFKYPGGEIDINHDFILSDHINTFSYIEKNEVIKAYLYSSDDIFKLILLKNALDNFYRDNPDICHSISLDMPYLPYGRHDRIFNKSYTNGIHAFSSIINSLNFDYIIILDSHSEDSINFFYYTCLELKIINSLDIISPYSSLTKKYNRIHLLEDESILLVSPDKGAEERVSEISKAFNLEFCVASKKRHSKTGKIISISIDYDVSGRNCLLIDDICDGGSTFIELAKVLKEKGANDLYLYVTNGIFSSGFDELKKYFKKIFCFNALHRYERSHQLIEEMKEEGFLIEFSPEPKYA